ncbi:DEAD/DEAH box helicase family protein [Labrenzia sp. ac12]
MTIQLRTWQSEALHKALAWLLGANGDRHFILNAAPGAGKTIAACVIAQELISRGEIDRVVVIAPRAEVVNQWARDFQTVTSRPMSKVTGVDGDLAGLGIDVCATWAAIEGLLEGFQEICRRERTLVICDEHHHAAVKAAWGDSADSAFAMARHVLILTGTPIRSDGAQSVWLAYDTKGAIDHPDAGTYTLSYGDAVDLGYCRPVTFHRHEGHFTVDLEDGTTVDVHSRKPADLTGKLKRVPGLQAALDFYRLACTPQYDPVDGVTPLLTGYQATMLDWGSRKLDELRLRMPEAGGLVIAPTIEMAEYMADLLESLEGERPTLVHSQTGNAESRIRAFRATSKRWIVSVAMISEGVDIKRLRVLVHLPNALTELAFRQAIGRVVRTSGPEDDTRAYVIMPSTETFEAYARRIEGEMPASQRKDPGPPKTKACPVCHAECGLSAPACEECGHEFSNGRKAALKACAGCGAQNPAGAESCHACGERFQSAFTLTLDEALRTGAIVRGMDLSEEEVSQAETLAAPVRNRILASGDTTLLRVIRSLPEESFARLKDILDGGSP